MQSLKMIKTVLGYAIAGTGFMGFIYFRNYTGKMIPMPFAWQMLSAVVGLAGIYLAFTGKKISAQKTADHLTQNREKIILTTDNCQVRENNYYEEITNNSISDAAVFDALYDPDRNHRTQLIEQSAIIFYYENAGKKIKMTSQSFPCNAETLSAYIKSGEVAIFINRFDKSDYAFEILG